MTDIDYYVFPLSPYCYLAGARLEDMAAKYGARVVYKPVLLMELFDETGGVRPAKRHPSRMAYRGQELARWGGAYWVAFEFETRVLADRCWNGVSCDCLGAE